MSDKTKAPENIDELPADEQAAFIAWELECGKKTAKALLGQPEMSDEDWERWCEQNAPKSNDELYKDPPCIDELDDDGNFRQRFNPTHEHNDFVLCVCGNTFDDSNADEICPECRIDDLTKETQRQAEQLHHYQAVIEVIQNYLYDDSQTDTDKVHLSQGALLGLSELLKGKPRD